MLAKTPSSDVAVSAAERSLLALGISGSIATVTIGPNGNRTKLTYPNGITTDYVYDDLNRLTNLTTINTATLGMIQSYQYTLGLAGNRDRIDEHDGTVRVYGYDDLYRLTSETITDDLGASVYSKSFAYDPVGNREQQTTVGTGAPGTPTAPGVIDYVYDVRDRIETEAGQSYTWDDNGNLNAKPDGSTYEWDFENRLEKVTLADGTTVEHVYDPDGNRVQTTTTPAGGTPEVTNFLVGTSGGLSHVVVETDGAGALVAQYVRGDDLLAVIRPTGSRFFHADGIGSIRRLANEAGGISDGYSYTAFGELLAHTGSDPQPYAFAGEPHDPNIGFQYHRARWMDPRVARFASSDPFGGVPHDPISLHRYLYANGSPLDQIDPTGQVSVATTLSGAAGISRIATTAILGARILNIVRLTAEEEITIEDAMYQIAQIARDQSIAYVGGHLLNRILIFARVPISKIPQLISLVNRNRLKGKFAEDLFGWANGAAKNTSRFGGRIPDFVKGKVWDELKYYEGRSVMYLTRQLRDMTAYAARHGIQFNLHVIPGSQVGSSVAAAVARTGGQIIRDLPRLEAQAFTSFGAALSGFLGAEDFWP